LNGNGSREEKKEERDLKIYILFEDKEKRMHHS
jgi:hypothetical protein